MKLNTIQIIFILSIIICFLILILYFISQSKENMENKEETSGNIELVVSRYNEDLEWLKSPPFNKYPVTCYNKGDNEDFYKPKDMKIIKLENVGRCDHTYIYHIINNYDKLSDLTIFLPGSCNMQHKKDIAEKLVIQTESHKDTVFIGNKSEKSIKDIFYNFSLDEWSASDDKNKSLNPEKKLLPSEIRPYGKWYEHHFGDKYVDYVCYFGIIGFHKKHILQHPKSYYETFIEELNKSSNPEVGHYFERSWAAIFGPLDGAKFIE